MKESNFIGLIALTGVICNAISFLMYATTLWNVIEFCIVSMSIAVPTQALQKILKEEELKRK